MVRADRDPVRGLAQPRMVHAMINWYTLPNNGHAQEPAKSEGCSVHRVHSTAGTHSELAAIDEALAASPDGTARRALARLLDQAKPKILEQWIELLGWQGLPHQRQTVRDRPESLYTEFSAILDVIFTWLHAPDAEAEALAREAVRSLYRGFGRQWAQRESAAPALAVDPPRITQAIWRVLLQCHDIELSAAEILSCAVTLNVLAMDLAMARVAGFLGYKEDVLTSQHETLVRLMNELTRVETRQRRALALELHDNLAQRLASLLNGIQHCGHILERDAQAAQDELRHLKQVASEAVRDARIMIRDLHFGVSSQDGGLSELADYVADLDADTGIRHEADIPVALPTLAPMQESLILRVIQEALRNAHKHARANRIVVRVEVSQTDLTVQIRDDGRGFDMEEALARSQRQGRLGLIGMRERADLMGGSLSILSIPDTGTEIQLTVPRQEQGS